MPTYDATDFTSTDIWQLYNGLITDGLAGDATAANQVKQIEQVETLSSYSAFKDQNDFGVFHDGNINSVFIDDSDFSVFKDPSNNSYFTSITQDVSNILNRTVLNVISYQVFQNTTAALLMNDIEAYRVSNLNTLIQVEMVGFFDTLITKHYNAIVTYASVI